jgi:hypothetical protein
MVRRTLFPAIALGLAAPAYAQSQATASSFIVGKWGDSRECRNLVEYRPDGTYRTERGDQGRWTLQGSRLTMRAQSQAVLAVRVINRNEMEVRLVGSRVTAVPGRSYRCRAAGRLAR